MMDKKTTGPMRVINRRITLFLFIGTISTLWIKQWADRQLHTDLLQKARMVAQLININRVEALTGTENDLEKPDYQRLKEQLPLARQADDKCRSFYLVGRKSDGKIFIYVDS
jgi:hypothetical protein